MPHFFYLAICLTLISCINEDRSWGGRNLQFDGTGYRPVYLSQEEASEVITKPGEPLVDPGKIYLLEPYLFVNEKGRGIHVIDNRDPSHPENISFISIPGNYDMAAKGNWLYADNNTDLLTFDISNPLDIRLTKRIQDAVPMHQYPPHTDVYFECVDPEKGVVVEWEKVTMNTRPKCRR